MRIHQADEFALHDERSLRQTAILFKVLEVRARLSIPNWHKQAIGADEKSSLPTRTC